MRTFYDKTWRRLLAANQILARFSPLRLEFDKANRIRVSWPRWQDGQPQSLPVICPGESGYMQDRRRVMPGGGTQNRAVVVLANWVRGRSDLNLGFWRGCATESVRLISADDLKFVETQVLKFHPQVDTYLGAVGKLRGLNMPKGRWKRMREWCRRNLKEKAT